MTNQKWGEIDMDAYRKLVSECKDNAEFRRRLREVPRKPVDAEKARSATSNDK